MNFGRVRSDSSPRSSNGHVHGTVLFGRVFAVRPGHNSRIVFTPLLSRFIGDSEPWSVRSFAQTCTLRDSHFNLYGTFGVEKNEITHGCNFNALSSIHTTYEPY